MAVVFVVESKADDILEGRRGERAKPASGMMGGDVRLSRSPGSHHQPPAASSASNQPSIKASLSVRQRPH